MFKAKKENTNSSITSTIIGEGIKVEGAIITGAGSLRVDGEFFGDVRIDGDIIVGETGYIKGNIRVNHALVAGKIDGNVISHSGVHLASTANLNGNVDASALVVDEGAIFSGSCNMSKILPSTPEIKVNIKPSIEDNSTPNNVTDRNLSYIKKEIEDVETDSNLSYTKK